MSKDVYEENKRLKAQIERMQGQERSDYEREREHQKQVEKLIVKSVEAFFLGQATLEIAPSGSAAGSGPMRVRFIGPGYQPKAL